MFSTEYSSTRDTHAIKSVYHQADSASQVIDRTEDLPEQLEDGELKKTIRERGGVTYVRGAGLLEADEFAVLNTNGDTISLMNYEGVPGLYKISEDGVYTLLIS